MKISELKANQGGINLEVEVTSVGEVKSFIRFGRVIRVANANIKDDSGETSLTLWNNEIDSVKPDAKIKITNGFVKEFQGELTVTAGKFGKIEVLDGEVKQEAESEEAPVEEAGAEAEEKVESKESEAKAEETKAEEAGSQ